MQNTTVEYCSPRLQGSNKRDNAKECEIATCSTIFTSFAVLTRLLAIILNWIMAWRYWRDEEYAYSAWTIGSILVPLIVTSLICFNILTINAVETEHCVFWKISFSYFFRDGYTLLWTYKWNEAKRYGNEVAQIDYYNRNLKEECNVGFVRLFDSFLESAPQKILLLTIILRDPKRITNTIIFTFVLYFGSIAWCLVAYNRSNRLAQLDKYDIGLKGLIAQFFYMLFLTVSRTLCIAYVISYAPFYASLGCLAHIWLCGTAVYLMDAPKFCKSKIFNYLFCISFGVVYLFIFTPIKDAPTKYKYCVYFVLCMAENITACCSINLMPFYVQLLIIGLYLNGILIMIIYYAYCHPRANTSCNLFAFF